MASGRMSGSASADEANGAIVIEGESISSVAVSVLMGSQRPPELVGRLTPRTGGWRGYDTTAAVSLGRVAVLPPRLGSRASVPPCEFRTGYGCCVTTLPNPIRKGGSCFVTARWRTIYSNPLYRSLHHRKPCPARACHHPDAHDNSNGYPHSYAAALSDARPHDHRCLCDASSTADCLSTDTNCCPYRNGLAGRHRQTNAHCDAYP